MSVRRNKAAKAMDGLAVEVPTLQRQGSKRIRTDKEEEKEKIARAKMAKSRQEKANEKHTDMGFSSCGNVLLKADKDWISDWIDNGRQYLASHLVSLCRNGMVERSYKSATQGEVANSGSTKLMKKLVKSTGLKWRAMGGTSSTYCIQQFFGDSELSWFQKPNPLPGPMAQKALRTMLGVTVDTWMPRGHDDGNYGGPLLPLLKAQWIALGRRCENSTKETLDRDSDYFYMSEGPTLNVNFLPNGMTSRDIDFGISLKDASDWYLLDPADFNECEIVSVSAGVQTRLAPKVRKALGDREIVCDAEFDFPDLSRAAGSSGGTTPVKEQKKDQKTIDDKVETLMSPGKGDDKKG